MGKTEKTFNERIMDLAKSINKGLKELEESMKTTTKLIKELKEQQNK